MKLHQLQAMLSSVPQAIIRFTAVNCQYCKSWDSFLNRTQQNGIKVIEIDAEKEIGLADHYNVFTVPTLLVSRQGEIDDRGVVTGACSAQKMWRINEALKL